MRSGREIQSQDVCDNKIGQLRGDHGQTEACADIIREVTPVQGLGRPQWWAGRAENYRQVCGDDHEGQQQPARATCSEVGLRMDYLLIPGQRLFICQVYGVPAV